MPSAVQQQRIICGGSLPLSVYYKSVVVDMCPVLYIYKPVVVDICLVLYI
jgi:hypothetical protein